MLGELRALARAPCGRMPCTFSGGETGKENDLKTGVSQTGLGRRICFNCLSN